MTRKLYERGYTKQQVLSLYRLIDWVLAMSKEMELAFEEKLLAYEKETSMLHITSAERIGIEKGQTSLIIRMLKRRWGAMDPELEVRLSRLSLAQLESLGETLMDFRDPSDLQRWLDDNAN